MPTFDRIVNLLETIWSRVGAAIMFAIMLIMVGDVCFRYLLNSPLDWSYELISLYLMPAVFFLALSDTMKHDTHVRVDILFNYVSSRARAIMEVVGHAISILLFTLMFYCSVLRTWTDFVTKGVIDGAVVWPTWITSALVPLGTGLLVLRIVILFLSGCGTLRNSAFEQSRDAGSGGPA